MKKKILKITLLLLVVGFVACKKDKTNPIVLSNAASADLEKIPVEWINKAKANLHIVYSHTSHGSQLIDGMTGLATWKGTPYLWNDGPKEGSLDIDDYGISGDLGNPDRTSWAQRTRDYLAQNKDVNVVIWSWCGQVSDSKEADITTYLNLMSGLETDYPTVKFVYMTGHLDGTGVSGNLNQRNEQIRKYCKDNGKYLYDFADIESYDPDGNYFLDKGANDNCDYDSDGNGSLDSNWAIKWQNAHPGAWYNCGAQHSQPLNANRKAYAAWSLWAKLAGWNGQ